MSFKWPPKDPNEILDYSVDWSRWLAGATISSVIWYVDDASNVKTAFTSGIVVNGLQNVSQTISGSIIQGNISGFFTINSGTPNNSTRWSLFNQSLLTTAIILPTDWSVAQYLIISAVGTTSRPMTFQNASITPI